MIAERKRGDAQMIANTVGCTKSYVDKILSGAREQNSRKAKLVIAAYKELKKAQQNFEQRVKMKLELEGE